jgi:hypothetical protein
MKNQIKITLISLITILILLSFNTIKPANDELIIPDIKALNNLYQNSQIESDDFVTDIDTKIKVRKVENGIFNNMFTKPNNGEILVQTVSLFSKSNKINGIGVHFYSKSSKNYIFNIYNLNKSTGELIKTKSFIVNLLSTVDIFLTNHIYFKKSEIDLFYDENYTEFTPKSNFNDLKLSLMQNDNNFSNKEFDLYNKIRNINPNDPCGYVGNCPNGGGLDCISPGFTCGDICPEKTLETESNQFLEIKNNYNISKILIENKYYEFRDEFLMKNEFGKKYIGIYYGMITHFKDVLDISTITKLLSVFPDINIAIDNLMNPNYKGIIINENLRSNILSITNEMKSNTTSSTFLNTLNVFEKDFNKFSLKTSMEINNLLNE